MEFGKFFLGVHGTKQKRIDFIEVVGPVRLRGVGILIGRLDQGNFFFGIARRRTVFRRRGRKVDNRRRLFPRFGGDDLGPDSIFLFNGFLGQGRQPFLLGRRRVPIDQPSAKWARTSPSVAIFLLASIRSLRRSSSDSWSSSKRL